MVLLLLFILCDMLWNEAMRCLQLIGAGSLAICQSPCTTSAPTMPPRTPTIHAPPPHPAPPAPHPQEATLRLAEDAGLLDALLVDVRQLITASVDPATGVVQAESPDLKGGCGWVGGRAGGRVGEWVGGFQGRGAGGRVSG